MTFDSAKNLYRLEELCKSIQDGDWIETKDQSSAGYRLLQIGNIAVGKFRESGKPRYVSEDTFHRLNCTKIEIGDVLIARMPEPTGRAWCVEAPIPDSITSVDVAIVRVDPTKLDAKYLAYFLNQKSTLQLMASLQTGSTRQRIKRSDLSTLEILTHPLNTQKAIAQFLTNLDQKISINSSLSETLENIAQTIFKSWFIDFDPVKAKMKGDMPAGMDAATASLFPDSMKESDFNSTPMSWESKKLGEVVDISWGDTKTTKASYVSTGFKAFSAKGQDGFLTKYDYAEMGIVLSAIGADCGKTWLATGKWSCIKNTMRIIAHPNYPDMIPYIYFLTKKQDFWERRGTAQPFIGQEDSRTLGVLIPSQKLVSKFAEIASPIFELIDALLEESNSLKALRDALLPRLISGELPLPTDILAS